MYDVRLDKPLVIGNAQRDTSSNGLERITHAFTPRVPIDPSDAIARAPTTHSFMRQLVCAIMSILFKLLALYSYYIPFTSTVLR